MSDVTQILRQIEEGDSSAAEQFAIAYGRDAADVAVYNQFGDRVKLLKMEVRIEILQTPPS